MCSLSVVVVAVEWPLLIAVTLAAGNFLAIATLSLINCTSTSLRMIMIAHNLYLGVLIFQQPGSIFRKAFALGSNVFATTTAICLGYHDHSKRCRRAIVYDAQRGISGVAQNTYFCGSICALDVPTLVLKASSTLTHRVHGTGLAMVMPCCRVFYASSCVTWLLLVLLSLKKCQIWLVQYATCQVCRYCKFSEAQVHLHFTADSLQCVSTQPATVVMQYSRHAYETHAYLLTYFALTLSYVHTDPDSLPSFADKCSFGNWSSDTYH